MTPTPTPTRPLDLVTNVSRYDREHWESIASNPTIQKKTEGHEALAPEVFNLLFKERSCVKSFETSEEATRLRDFTKRPGWRALKNKCEGSPVRSTLGTIQILEAFEAQARKDEMDPNPGGEGANPGEVAKDLDGKIDDARQAGGGVGIDSREGEVEPEKIGDLLGMADALTRNPEIRQVMELAGRLRKLMRKKKNAMVYGHGAIAGVETGGRFERLLPAEVAKWTVPSLRDLQTKRIFLDRKALQFKYQRWDTEGLGPVCLTVDASGSMSGQNMVWARATALALLQTCSENGRDLDLSIFDTRILDSRTFPKGRHGIDDIGWITGWAARGGTSFDAPVEHALSHVEGSPKSDVIIVTDGCARLRSELVERAQAVTESKGTKWFAITLGSGGDETWFNRREKEDLDLIVEDNVFLNVRNSQAVDALAGGIFRDVNDE